MTCRSLLSAALWFALVFAGADGRAQETAPPLPELLPEAPPTPSEPLPASREPSTAPSAPISADTPPPANDDEPVPATGDEERNASSPAPRTRLLYRPGRFDERCPSEEAVRAGITARLGESPFAEPAERVVVLALEGHDDVSPPSGEGKEFSPPGGEGKEFSPSGGEGNEFSPPGGEGREFSPLGGEGREPPPDEPVRARVELFDGSFQPLGARMLQSDEGCEELVAAGMLAISIALSPGLLLSPEPAAPATAPAPVPEVEALPPEPEAPPTEVPAPRPYLTWLPPGTVFLVGGGAHGEGGVGPQATVGVHVTAAARRDWWSVALEHRQSLPLIDLGLGVLHGGSSYGALPCGHLPFAALTTADTLEVYGCGALTVGSIWGVGRFISGAPHVAAGARLGVAWTRGDLSGLRAWSELSGYVLRPEFFAFNGDPGFRQSSPMSVRFGVSYEIPWPQ